MKYNSADFIKALEESFLMYKVHGARSTAKLIPLHGYIAKTVGGIFGTSYEVHYMGAGNSEMTVDGKYYPKDIDITITKDGKAVFCLGIKFVTSNYKQNANNYFETMMGETANIQAVGSLPYAHLIVFRHETPYYKKNETETPSRIEIIDDRNIQKYLKLQFDRQQAHRPDCIGIQIINVDEKTGKVSFTDLERFFSETTVKFLKTKLSVENLFKEIENYKDFLETLK